MRTRRRRDRFRRSAFGRAVRTHPAVALRPVRRGAVLNRTVRRSIIRGTISGRTVLRRSVSRRPRCARLLRRYRRSVVDATSSLGSYYAASFEFGRARRGSHWRSTVVLPRKQSTVMACGLLMLQLRRNRSAMRFVGIGRLLRRRARGDTAPSAVVRHVGIIVYDDRLVVDIGHVRDIHIGNRPVVEESAAAPLPAREAFSEVSESVINASIKSNVRAPIAG